MKLSDSICRRSDGRTRTCFGANMLHPVTESLFISATMLNEAPAITRHLPESALSVHVSREAQWE